MAGKEGSESLQRKIDLVTDSLKSNAAKMIAAAGVWCETLGSKTEIAALEFSIRDLMASTLESKHLALSIEFVRFAISEKFDTNRWIRVWESSCVIPLGTGRLAVLWKGIEHSPIITCQAVRIVMLARLFRSNATVSETLFK